MLVYLGGCWLMLVAFGWCWWALVCVGGCNMEHEWSTSLHPHEDPETPPPPPSRCRGSWHICDGVINAEAHLQL